MIVKFECPNCKQEYPLYYRNNGLCLDCGSPFVGDEQKEEDLAKSRVVHKKKDLKGGSGQQLFSTTELCSKSTASITGGTSSHR